MKIYSCTTILIVLNILNASHVYSQCIRGKPNRDKDFPDPSKIVSIGYTTTVEISVQSLKQTIIATEYYDVINGNGRVDFMTTGEKKQFLYFNDTKETFNIKNFRCETEHINTFIPIDEKMVYDWRYEGNDRTVLGPSAMLWNAQRRFMEGEVDYMGTVNDEYIRGVRAEFWRGCLNDELLIVEYYFEVREWHHETGIYSVNLPLRITIRGETGVPDEPLIDQTYEFMQSMPNIRNRRTVFAIPTGVGCTRLSKDLPEAPSFDGYDMSYTAEILYSQPTKNHFYVTNLNYVEDAMSDHVGYYFSTWGKVGRDSVLTSDSYRFIVYNKQNGFLYNITTEKKSCIVTKEDDFDDGVPLPGDISLNIKNELIVGDSNGLTYLGQSKRRGILTDVFEESTYLYGNETTKDFLSAVVSRFYISEGEEYETGFHVEGTPLQVLMRMTDTKSKTSAELVINIYGFTTKLEQKNELFDVQSCSQSHKNKLFHLIFEVHDENIILSVRNTVPLIKEQVLQLLIESAELTPLRVHDILIEFDTKGIHAFATVLERPDIMLDFELAGHYTLEDADDEGGLYTIPQCAKFCLESVGICRAFSHCGAACYISISESSAQNTKENKNCRFYKRLGAENFANSRILTTYSAIRKLSSTLSEAKILNNVDRLPSLLLSWKNVKGEIENQKIPLTDFKAELGDIDNMINTPVEDFDDHFAEYRYGAKLKKDANHVQSYGAIPNHLCQEICLKNPECESLSSCLGLPECLVSYKHADELEDSDFVKARKCIVITKRYVDSFVEYPGLVMVKQASRETNASNQDSCAKSCLNATDLPCRSFDYCPWSENNNDRCLLHTSHFFSVENKTTDITVDDSGLCGHYSRNYVYDFKKIGGKSMATGSSEKYIEISGVTKEECAIKCLQNGGFICNAFDHCEGPQSLKSFCRLNSKIEKEEKLIMSPICNYYIRESDPRKEDKVTRPKRRKKISMGVVVGLAFFFLFVGFGLGVVIVFAHGWYTGKKL